MAKNAITDYDTNPANNTDVGSIGIQGNNIPSNFDNSQREIMSHLADMNAGTSPLHDTFAVADPDDLTKKVRLDAGNVTSGQTRVISVPDKDFTLIDGSELVDTVTFEDPDDAAKKFRFDGVNITTGNTRVITIPDKDFTLGDGVNAPNAVAEDQKTSSTAGGSFTSGSFATRDLNTVTRNLDSIMTLSSNEFSFTSDGWVEWSCPAFRVNRHYSRLYNVTDSTVVAVGTNEYCSSTDPSTTQSTGGADVTSGKTYRLEHNCSTTRSTDGFGIESNSQTNVYSRLKYWKR